MNIYDFDNTIYDGDSSKDFFKYCLKRKKTIIFDIIPICFTMFLYLIKIVEKEKFKSSFFRFLKRIDGKTYIDDFWKINKKKIKSFYVKNHKDTDVIISASPYFLLEPIAKEYNFKLIATSMDIKNGKINGNNCYGQEKVKRLKENGISKCDCFYSDSLSDAPCSKLAKKSFIVKNDEIIPWNNYKESRKKKILKYFLSRDFITFLFIGFINVINGIWISLVYSLVINGDVLAYIMGFFTSLVISYILNSLLNFKSKLKLNKFLKFAINNIPNFIIQVLCLVILLNKLNLPKIICYAISSCIAVPVTFLLVKINVFSNKTKD